MNKKIMKSSTLRKKRAILSIRMVQNETSNDYHTFDLQGQTTIIYPRAVLFTPGQ